MERKVLKRVVSNTNIFLFTLVIVMLMSALNISIVNAESEGGWHLIETQYFKSSLDFEDAGEHRSGVIATSDVLWNKYTSSGSEGDMTFGQYRRFDDGTEIFHVVYQVIWSKPPAYLPANETVGFDIEYKIVSSNNLGGVGVSAKIDAATLGLGSSAFNISFVLDDGTSHIYKDTKGIFKSEKVMPKGSPGAKKAIQLYLGNSYGYVYIYEWKEGSAPTTPITPAQPTQSNIPSGIIDMRGIWDGTLNRSTGTLNVQNQDGNGFIGEMNIDGSNIEKLTKGSIEGNVIKFTRQWASGNLWQDYVGTIAIDANGYIKAEGTFTQSGTSTIYNWRATKREPLANLPAPPAPAAPAVSTSTDKGAEAFESGARLMWPKVSNVLGYRLYRSKTQSQLGISVTDFYITSTSYADVNVEANTTYYYSVKPILAEANPYQNIEEKLGDVIATFVVTTGSEIYKPGLFKHFIMLKLDSPYMSVDGVEQEVDPGRGTCPIILAGRTMVPIRAVVEAMGGTVGWDQGTSKITLEARGNKVEMWLGKTDIKVNGATKEMDIALVAKDGRTYVPVRFAAENLNCKVDWINSTKEAVIVYEE